MLALILLSGGVDSTVCLALALKRGLTCFALSYDYGQKHRIELESAIGIASHYQVPHQIIKIDPTVFSNTSLVTNIPVPKYKSLYSATSDSTSSTYVPARNTLFLSYALGQAERLNAEEIHFGANLADLVGYPDCRPSYFAAFQSLANFATRQGSEGRTPQICTPLIDKDKRAIVTLGKELKVPLDLTHSCYDPTPQGAPCHSCIACLIREDAFLTANP